jgi:hypothetical protein
VELTVWSWLCGTVVFVGDQDRGDISEAYSESARTGRVPVGLVPR